MPFAGAFEDRAAIRELLEAYADAVIRADAADWASTWSDEDAEWQIIGHPSLSKVEGKSAIIDAWTARMQQLTWIMFSSSVGLISVNGNRATARSYTTESYGFDGRIHRAFGRYDDELVREQGAWRFRVRRLTTIARD
jgi:ketosteroid isomerase-like protein